MANLTIVSSIAYAYGTNGYTTTGTYPSTEVCKIGGGDGNRIRLTFPSLLTHPDCIGKNIRITSMFLALWRTDGTGGSFPITIKYSKGDRWDDDTGEAGAVHTSGKTEWNNCYSTNTAYGVPTVSNSNFYVHLSSTQTSSYANVSIGYTPHIYFYWEEVNGDFAGDATNTIGGTIGCNVPRGSSNERYTIYAQFGAENMVLCENVTPPTGTEPDVFVSVNAPLSYGLQIPDTSSGNVYLEAVCSVNGNITKRYFQNAQVSFDSSTLQAPVIAAAGFQLTNGIGNIAVGGISSATAAPTITTYNGYGARIASVTLAVTGGSSSANTNISWNQASIMLAEEWVAAQYGYQYELDAQSLGAYRNTNATYTYTLTVTDTRGAVTTTTWTQEAVGYTKPRISKFNVQRCTNGSLDPTGTSAMVTIDMTAYKMTASGTQINSVEWALLIFDPSNNRDIFVSYPAGSTATNIVYTQNLIDSSPSYYFKLHMENDSTNLGDVTSTSTTYADNKKYQCQLRVRDATGQVTIAYNEIPLGGPVLSLSGKKTGVAFGMLSTATDTQEKLESRYPFYAYGGIPGTTGCSYEEEEVIGGTWVNEAKLYRKTISVYKYASTATEGISVGETLSMVVGLDGIFVRDNGYIYPINWQGADGYTRWTIDGRRGMSGQIWVESNFEGRFYLTVYYVKGAMIVIKEPGPYLTTISTAGTAVSYSVAVRPLGLTYTYQWQYKPSGGDWIDFDPTTIPEAATENFSFEPVETCVVRCAITNAQYGTVYSREVRIVYNA